jgi:methylthioribose-1-phosphate isomerase
MFDWPVATVLLGTLATLAVGIMKWAPRRGEEPNGRIYARATDLVEIGARLTSLESAHHTLRAELRADMKDIQEMIRQLVLDR